MGRGKESAAIGEGGAEGILSGIQLPTTSKVQVINRVSFPQKDTLPDNVLLKFFTF